MIERNFLSEDDRERVTSTARAGLAEHRVARRPDAIPLLDSGWGCGTVSNAPLLDDDTLRGWFKAYRERGVAASETFDFGGRHRSLSIEQRALSKAWATLTLPASTNAGDHHIGTTFDVSYTRSGFVKSMAAIGFVTRMREVSSVDAQSTIDRLTSVENAYATMRRIHVHPDNARHRQARAVQEWMGRPGQRVVLHFIPGHCPHLNPIGRLWGVMHQNVTHNLCHATVEDLADAILTFFRETGPKNLDRFSDRVTDNCCVRDTKNFRILASQEHGLRQLWLLLYEDLHAIR